ncbi:MAG: hypothetical protein Q9192_000841 [Flavoplaca navasiana]
MALEAAHDPKVPADPYDDDDLTLNINSKLVNPFVGLAHEEMDDLISHFMEKTSIDEIYAEHIRKGAYLAQDRSAFDDLRDDALTLKPEERSALRMEDPKTGNKWNQPWILMTSVAMRCAWLTADPEGWDEVRDALSRSLHINHGFDKEYRQLSTETAFGIFLGYVAGVAFRSVLDGDSNVCPRDGSEATLLRINCVSPCLDRLDTTKTL